MIPEDEYGEEESQRSGSLFMNSMLENKFCMTESELNENDMFG